MPDYSLEAALGCIVAGIDEVGRGPLAGPVIAAAVIFDPARAAPCLLTELDDSKKIPKKHHHRLAALVQETCAVGIGEATVAEIDRLNILKATFLAMRRALDALGRPVDAALVDGNQPPPLPCRVRCITGGDGLSLSIAAASVVAKAHRDHLMRELARIHPEYGWEKNAGYGTAQHMAALARLGPTPHHRTSFAPIAQLVLL
jgi:ribonuclease HII